MKDILNDIVTHTYGLGFLPLVKVTSENGVTTIDSKSDDNAVIMTGKAHNYVNEFAGVFGMPNLEKLALHLKNPEYKENAKIKVVTANRDGVDVPVSLHFENGSGNFKNDYRFMNTALVQEKLKPMKFKGASWDVEFAPSMAATARMKLQAQAHSEEKTFQVKTENGDLIFSFGDASTHSGSFVFEAGVKGVLKHSWSWPIVQFMSIMSLDGDKIVKISDGGAMMIVVDSGVAEYTYILPSMSK